MPGKSRQQVQPVGTILSRFTVEQGLYVLIGVVAACLRFGGLGQWPLLTKELSHAVPALMAAQGKSGTALGYSPLLYTADLLAFVTVGASDAVTRILPALFGTVLVILPYFLRPVLGRVGSLAVSICLALSPTFLFFSRTSDGAIIVATCVLSVMIVVLNYTWNRRSGWLTWGVVAFTLALTASPGVYTYLFIAVLCAAWVALTARSEEIARHRAIWEEMARVMASRKNLLLGGSVLLFVCTALLFNLSGLQACLDLFATWVRHLKPLAGERPWYYYIQLLLIYEAPVLILGLVGLGISLRQHDRFGQGMGFWFGFALLFYTLLGPRQPGALVVILLPLVLLTGRAVESLGKRITEIGPWEFTLLGLSVPVLGFAYLQVARYVQLGTASRLLGYAAIIVFLLVVTFVAFGFWAGRREALRASILVLCLIAAVVMIRTSVRLNYRYARHPQEPILVAPTSPHTRDLVRELINLSQHRVGDQHEIDILVERDLQSYMAWLLRDFPNVEYASSISADAGRNILIAAKKEGDVRPRGYIGERFTLRSTWPGQRLGTRDWLRWLVLGEDTGQVQREKVEVWVKIEVE